MVDLRMKLPEPTVDLARIRRQYHEAAEQAKGVTDAAPVAAPEAAAPGSRPEGGVRGAS
jgi:hypothetical protein